MRIIVGLRLVTGLAMATLSLPAHAEDVNTDVDTCFAQATPTYADTEKAACGRLLKARKLSFTNHHPSNQARLYGCLGRIEPVAGTRRAELCTWMLSVVPGENRGMRADLYQGSGQANKQAGDLIQAVSDYAMAVRCKTSPVDSFNWAKLASAIAKEAMEQKSTEGLETALEVVTLAIFLNPYPGHVFDRGEYYRALGMTEKALQDYKRAISKHPGYRAAYESASLVLVKMGKQDEAKAYADAALKLPVTPADPLMNGPTMTATAIRSLTNAESSPQWADLAAISAAVAVQNKNRDDMELAAAFMGAAIYLDPTNYKYFDLRGKYYMKLDRTKRSLKDYQKAIALKPDMQDAYHGAVLALMEMGNRDEARKYAQDGLKYPGRFSEALMELLQGLNEQPPQTTGGMPTIVPAPVTPAAP